MALKSRQLKSPRPVRRRKNAARQDEAKRATKELTGDPSAMASIARGEADIARGRTVAWRDVRRD